MNKSTISSPSLQLEQEKEESCLRDTEIQGGISLTKRQLELAKIEEIQESSIFQNFR